MSHLTPDQLSAVLDQRLDAQALQRAELHLRECGTCRDALADLESQDQILSRALDHDPGPAYFESFADRVGERLRAESLAGAQERNAGRLASIFRSPRRLAMVGAAAAVVVGAGIVLMSVKETEFPRLRGGKGVEMAQQAPTTPAENEIAPSKDAAPEDAAARAEESEEGQAQTKKEFASAPASPGAKRALDERSGVAAPPPVAALEKSATADKRALTSPNRLQEVRRNEAGEMVVVPNAELDRLRAPANAAPAPTPASQPIRVPKQTRAAPMRETQNMNEQQFRPDDAKLKTQNIPSPGNQTLTMQDAGAGRVCGVVRDPLGRAVSGAQVIVRETGTAAATDAQGHFCLEASAGVKTLAVMAVGYRSAELSVQIGGDEQYASIQIVPVNPAGALGDLTRGFASAPKSESGAPAGGLSLRGGRPNETKVSIGVETLSPAARTAMTNARRLSAVSGRANTTAAGQAAAQEWERAATLLPQGAAMRDARFEAARERYGVWQRNPSTPSADFAVTAIRRFLEVEPLGARRTLAEGWLKTLGR